MMAKHGISWLTLLPMAAAFGLSGCGTDELDTSDEELSGSSAALGEEPAAPDGRDVACRDRVRAAVREAVSRCRENDGGRRRCAAVAEETRRHAMRVCAGHDDQDANRGRPEGERPGEGERPRLGECEARCGLAAREIAGTCVDDGGDREACGAEGRAAHGACIEEHCAPFAERGAPPVDACHERCGGLGREDHRQCLEAGGTDEDCLAGARETVGSCIADHCLEAPQPPAPPSSGAPPPPPPASEPPVCEDRCLQQGRQVGGDCVEAGGLLEDCRAEAQAATRECIATHCPAR